MRNNTVALPAVSNRKSKGFSLIEMMIVLVIGLVLISGMITIFSATNQSSRLARAVATIQEDAHQGACLVHGLERERYSKLRR